MIEVEHNPNKLLIRKTYKIRRPTQIEKAITKFMKDKQPRGLRVRYMIDVPTARLHCETRNAMAMGTFLNYLREQGFLIERVREMEVK